MTEQKPKFSTTDEIARFLMDAFEAEKAAYEAHKDVNRLEAIDNGIIARAEKLAPLFDNMNNPRFVCEALIHIIQMQYQTNKIYASSYPGSKSVLERLAARAK